MEPVGFYSVNGSIRIFLGAGKENFVQKGVGPDVFASYQPDEDEGSSVVGAAGATMLVQSQVGSFTMTITFLPTATGNAALQALRSLGTAFPVNVVTGDGVDAERLQGRGIIQNTGNVELSKTGAPRSYTIKIASTSYQVGPIGTRLE